MVMECLGTEHFMMSFRHRRRDFRNQRLVFWLFSRAETGRRLYQNPRNGRMRAQGNQKYPARQVLDRLIGLQG